VHPCTQITRCSTPKWQNLRCCLSIQSESWREDSLFCDWFGCGLQVSGHSKRSFAMLLFA
jgi:hypothetical protein